MRLNDSVLEFYEESIDVVWVSCFSEKEAASIGAGASIEVHEQELDVDVCTMQEAFWENYFEFEPGIEKVKILLKNNSNMTLRQAIVEVFGHFYTLIHINEKEIDVKGDCAEELEECMYSMLEALYS